jgi:Domain of unknown function (DUF4303)
VFNLVKLADFAQTEIEKFSALHQEETFYAFSIDANMLCLNSEERFRVALAEYQKEYPEYYNSAEKIKDLKYNTGDWEYQGFAELTDENGFDSRAYSLHYDMNVEKQKVSDYGLAMDKLLEILCDRNVFGCLKRTDDFISNRVEHNY